MNIGLFFGSFNPIHIGHLIIANTVAELKGIDQVWFVVSPLNPFKSSKNLLHEFDRMDMVELAIEDNFNLRASDIEFRMKRPSYTIDTLTYLSERHPNYNFELIIGGDNLKGFHKWKNYKVILEHYGLIVYPRPQSIIPEEIKAHANVRMINAPLLDISATYIRKQIREGKSIQYIVPQKVAEHIAFKKLYL